MSEQQTYLQALEKDYLRIEAENERYKQALEEIVNIDGRFIAADEELDPVKAYDWVDEIARKTLKGESE